MIGDIDVTTNLPDLEELGRRLSGAEREVFVAHEREVLSQYEDNWTGWKYEGRPAAAPRNVSQQEWRTNVQSTERGAALIVENKARDWRTRSKAYVEYVHHAGKTTPEWVVQTDQAKVVILPKMIAALTAAIADGLAKPGRTRKIRAGTGPTQTETLEF